MKNLAHIVSAIEKRKKHLETEIRKLNVAIVALVGKGTAARDKARTGARRKMSAAGRAKISAAQKKRWAQHKSKHA